jgi:hypothetical protein
MSPPLISKAAAHYTGAGGKEHCSLCRHFSPRRGGRCARVLGDISPRGWCRLFSREVRSLIADASSFNGGAGGPALALDFLTPGTLDPRLTFARASTATYFDSAGVMQTAAVNAPRWDYDPATLALRGLLLEDQRTNLAFQSADLSHASWLKAGLVVVAPTVTANQAIAPDGNLTAARVVYPAVPSATNTSVIYQNQTVTAAAYTFSVWLRGNVGGEQLYLAINVANASYSNSARITLTTQWQRFTYTTPTLTAAAWTFDIGTDLRGGTQTSTLAQTIFAWGAQIELGDHATSYIPTTTAAVVRSIDVCAIPPANMGWFTGTPGGSWFAEFDYFDNSPTNSRIIGRPNFPGGQAALQIDAARVVRQFDAIASMPSSGATATTINTVVRSISTWDVGQAKLCTNGGAVLTAATLTQGYGAFVASGIRFLSVGAALAVENCSGHIRNVRYWPAVLDDAQMQTLTAP